MSKRTITLTHCAHVSIEEDNWPLIATAKDLGHDGPVQYQATCTSKWFLGVCQHEDGRAIVYATYTYTSQWQHARCYSAKAGFLLPVESTSKEICAALLAVSAEMAAAECQEGDADRWPTLAAECIADLPAESLE